LAQFLVCVVLIFFKFLNGNLKMKKALLLSIGISMAVFSACSKKNDNPGPQSGACMADQLALTQTKSEASAAMHTLFLTFDTKNTGATDYDVTKGSKMVQLKVTVTTTDNSTYESTQPVTIVKLSAGGTATMDVLAEYGAGKTFKSYKIEKYCD
jgi:hypothetical protein